MKKSSAFASGAVEYTLLQEMQLGKELSMFVLKSIIFSLKQLSFGAHFFSERFHGPKVLTNLFVFCFLQVHIQKTRCLNTLLLW